MIVAAVLAVAASVAFGVGDGLSGAAVRRHATAALALWAQVTGLIVLGTVALARRPEATFGMLGFGAAAGAVSALAVLAFYTALQRGTTSVIAPIAGSGVVLPVLAGLISGEPLGWPTGIGIGAVIIGIIVVSIAGDDATPPMPIGVPGPAQPVPVHDGYVPTDGHSARSAVLFAVAAAAGFGSFFPAGRPTRCRRFRWRVPGRGDPAAGEQ